MESSASMPEVDGDWDPRTPVEPTDRRWVPDEKRRACIGCGAEFGMLLTRRHHCRGCGEVFCSDCSPDTYQFKTGPDRVCFVCLTKRVNTITALDQQVICEKICGQCGEEPMFMAPVERRPNPRKQSVRSREILVLGRYTVWFILPASDAKSYKIAWRRALLDFSGAALKKRGETFLEFSDHFGQRGNVSTVFFLCAESAPMLKHLRQSFREITVGFPDGQYRLQASRRRVLELEPLVVGPANGLIDTYKAYCHYFSVPVREELVTYLLDLISSNIREIDLTTCPGVDAKDAVRVDLRPMLASLAYNQFFNSVLLDELRAEDSTVLMSLGVTMLSNTTITKISVDNAKNVANAIQALGEALAFHPSNGVQVLHLSTVPLSKGRATERLCNGLANLTHSLKSLVLRDCDLKPQHFEDLFQSFRNYGMSLAIESLDLSYNELGDVGSAALGSWLEDCRDCSSLKNLLIRHTKLNLSNIARFLHFLPRLQILDISGTNLSNRALVELLCTTADKCALNVLCVEDCDLDIEHADILFQAVTKNKRIHNARLEFGGNPMHVSDKTASLFQKSHMAVTNIASISIAGCALAPSAFIDFVNNLSNVSNLRSLVLSRGLRSSKSGATIADAVFNLLASVPSIHALGLANNFPVTVVIPFLERLADNHSLLELDISNNGLGSPAGSVLASFLRKNDTLQILDIDGNNLGLQCSIQIEQAVAINSTLQRIGFVWHDYHGQSGKMDKHELKRFQSSVLAIQEKLWQNRRKAAKSYSSLLDELRGSFTDTAAPTDVAPFVPVPDYLAEKSITPAGVDGEENYEPDSTENIQENRGAVASGASGPGKEAVVPATLPPPDLRGKDPIEVVRPSTPAAVRDDLAPVPARGEMPASSPSRESTGGDSLQPPTPPPAPKAPPAPPAGPPPKAPKPPAGTRGAGKAPARAAGRPDFLESIEGFKKDALRSTDTVDRSRPGFLSDKDGPPRSGQGTGSLADVLSSAIMNRRLAMADELADGTGDSDDSDDDDLWVES